MSWGANWGEVSLYLAKMNPQAKILAVEASTDNFKILGSNIKIQAFNTSNILCLNEAVTDKKGTIEISKGKGAENTTLKNHWQNTLTETVSCDTLSSLIDRFHFNTIDFLKIDIEGTEPQLFESLKENIHKIKSLIVEVGSKIPHEPYIPMLSFLWESNMECYEWQHEEPISTFEELRKHVTSRPSLDLWFIKRQTN